MTSCRLLLWTGPKHSGKTAVVSRLADRAGQQSISVAGILAPSVYQHQQLVGFDIVDLQTNQRRPLARRHAQGSQQVGQFVFTDEGIEFGRLALQSASSLSDGLIVVDEFGPLELEGGGWRRDVDSLICDSPAVVILVVRDELADRVAQIYSRQTPQIISCRQPDAFDRVVSLLIEKP